LLLVIAFGARPVDAEPSAYVTNFGDNTVSVIDTATIAAESPFREKLIGQ